MKKTLQVAGSLVPLLLLLLVYVGDTYTESLVTVLVFVGLTSILILSAFMEQSALIADESTRSAFLFAKGAVAWWIRLSGVTGLGLLTLLISSRPYQFMVIFPQRTGGFWIAVSVAAALLALLAIRPPKPLYSLLALAVAGLAIRLLWFSQWEIDPAKRDMLALVISAIERFLSGENPYGFHQMQVGSEVPLTYPPGLWLAHLPAYVLGLDIRWTAWLSDAVIVFCLGWSALRSRSTTVGPVFVALAGYLFLPDIHWNGIYAEPHADWAVLAGLIAAAMSGRPLLSGALFGVALTTRPFNLVLLPFFAVWLFRQFGFEKARRAVIAAGTVAAALYLPFVLADPDAFFAGTVRWLLDYGPAHRTWFFGKLSFSGILYKTGNEHLLAPAQGAVIIIASALAIWKLRSIRHLLAFWTAVYGLFVAFNSIVWMSFWIGVCLLATGLLSAKGDPASILSAKRSDRKKAPTKRKIIALETGLATIIATSLVVMLILLHRHFSVAGKEAVLAFLDKHVEAGDRIIDRSGYREGILKTPYLLGAEELPVNAELNVSPFQAAVPRRRFVNPLSLSRIIAVERFGLFKEDAALFLGDNEGKNGPYRLDRVEAFANYNVYLLIRQTGAKVFPRWSEQSADLVVNAFLEGDSLRPTRRGNAWQFQGAPRARVRNQPCRIDNSQTEMLSATPVADLTYTLKAAVPRGAKWLTLFGGFPDRTAAWHKSDVTIDVGKESGKPFGEQTFPNRSGMSGATFQLPKGVRSVTLDIRTRTPENRRFCFDALFSGII